MARQRDEIGQLPEGRVAGGVERHAEMIDQQAQARMALRELADLRQIRRRGERDRNVALRGAAPEPLDLVAGQPTRMARLVEDVAQAEHAGLSFAAREQLRAVGRIGRKVAEHREASGIAARRVERDGIGVGIPGRRLDYGGVDAGGLHVGERFFRRIGLLAVGGARRTFRPDVDVGVDDAHATRP